MKISCLRSDLQTAISNVSRAVSGKSTIPALEGVLVKAHGDKLREASRRSHAKRRAEIAAAASNLKAIFDAVCGLVSETGAEEFDHFYKKGGEAMMNDFENAVRAICRGR